MSDIADCLQKQIFEFTDKLLNFREDAIKDALNNYYGVGKWSESMLVDSVVINVDAYGGETLLIHGMPMVYFGQLGTDTKIDGVEVKCYFGQEIRVLYK